ncbi:RNA polymerase sigma-70 factor [Bacteroidia bacterium]|nr:RNA polymerase sigma-70 factor [Bacteroidia bacterium]
MSTNYKGEINIESLFLRIALQDDEEAFRELFVQFFTPLCIFAKRYLNIIEDCENIVQDTFLKIWENRKSLNISTSGRNFLITSVRNACIDHLRKQESERRYLNELSENQLLVQINLYSIKELEDMLSVALTGLSENVRNIFEMNRFEGKTYTTIASEQNLSVKTVEAYMTKALKHLRNELKDYLPFILLFL